MTPAKILATLQEALDHHQAGRLDLAASQYEQVQKVAPKNFDAIHLAGTVAYQQGDYAKAARLLTRALTLEPKSAPCALRLGLALLAEGQPVAAERQIRASLARQRTPEALDALGLVLRALGMTSEALKVWTQAVALQPGSAEIRDHLGALIADLQGFDAALPHFQKAVKLNPDYANAWCNLGLAQAQTEQVRDAFVSFNRALALNPTLHQARLGCGLAHQKLNQIEAAIVDYGAVLDVQPANHEARSARLLCLNYLDSVSPETLFEEHRRFGEAVESALPRRKDPPAPTRPDPLSSVNLTQKIRLAFFSPDLRAHSVTYFLEPLLRHLDPEQFEVVLYHDHPVVDDVSARLRERASIWRNFASQPNATVESRIRSDAPDVLMDLAGHTGFNRLPLFARRLAALQISYLGYPNTTGLTAMDVRLTDSHADPAGRAETLHTEKLVRLPQTAWTYQPPVGAPDVTLPPCASGCSTTFGSFNNAAKISGRTISLWSRVLAAVPDSRLVLKGHGLTDQDYAAHLRAAFASHQIDPCRIELRGRISGLENHLAVYHQIDIALDTFPYHGTTTTCEALWMGRATVTLAGDRHASRVGVSLLTAAGHPEWIAKDDEDYVGRAVQLASDPSGLVRIAQRLRSELQHSPLLDHPGQARRFGDAIRGCLAEKTTKGHI